jgi:hypothetical protein
MSPPQIVLGHLGTALVVAALAGLLARRRFRLWYAFALYLVAVAIYSLLVAFLPQRFHTSRAWQTNEIALIAIRIAMVVELAFREFRRFPGALATMRRAFVVIVVLTFAAILWMPTTDNRYTTFVGQFMPRFLNGTIWLFTALAGLTLWYRLPIDAFRKRILLSYVPYLLIFTVLLDGLGRLGWKRALPLDLFNQVAYCVLLLYWTYAAWKR